MIYVVRLGDGFILIAGWGKTSIFNPSFSKVNDCATGRASGSAALSCEDDQVGRASRTYGLL